MLNELGPAFVNRRGKISKLTSPSLTRLIPGSDRLSSKRADRRIVDVKILLPFLGFDHRLSCTMAQQLMEHNPPMVRGELVLGKRLCLRGVDERVL